MTALNAHKPAQICAPTREVRDLVGEALRRERFGLIRPLWADADDELRNRWRQRADDFLRVLESLCAKIEVAP